MIPQDLVLENEHVCLEPLELRHAPDLFEAGNNPEVWRKAGRSNQMSSLEATREYINDALMGETGGVPFAIIEKRSGKAIGSTRYFEISERDGRLEIGWTWIHPKYWRTHINSSCKLLLLQYAFETASFERVQLKADAANDRSCAAILRLGATYEGTLRNFRVVEGTLRSVSYYSILRDEWPTVKERLAGCSLRPH